METFLFDKLKYDQLYNCSFYDINQIPLEERRHKFWGVFFLVGYVVFMILYIPCLYAMLKSDLRRKTSYKLMIQLGFTQLVGLQIGGLFIGIQTLNGVVFCSQPQFEYLASCLIFGHWIATSTTSDVLGFNRLCVLYNRDLTRKLFEGKKLYLWMAFPVCYGSLMGFFTTPIFFNSKMVAFFSNPHYGYFEDTTNVYFNPLLAVHNISICFTEAVIYTLMPIFYFRARRLASNQFRSQIRYEKQTCEKSFELFEDCFEEIQTIFKSTHQINLDLHPSRFDLHHYSTISYYTCYDIIRTIGYLLSQGMASFVYLGFNHSIRKTIFKRLKLRPGRQSSTQVYHFSQPTQQTPQL
ncbi:hypothetical protein M3Y97_01144600 [Aphelenchoides bicaudatus]|nr:hypothetical protein M3Y97_01144600 [Aphelenchoides bicaudatus]